MTHYEERLQADLTAIRGKVVELGEHLDGAIADAVRSLLRRDHALAAKTILGDLPVNRASRLIDAMCHRFVARHLPSAGILRFVSAVLRISTALERIGDYAVSIAREAVQQKHDPPEVVAGNLQVFSEQARGMLAQAIRAFGTQSADLARGTMVMESQADRVYRKIYRDLVAEGERQMLGIRELFGLLIAFYRLERITDQAKNLCEETVFAVTGEVKAPKVYRILFVDERNTGGSLMAQAIARKAFPESGHYWSAGWSPVAAVDPGFVAFMDRHGHDAREMRPAALDPSFEALQQFHVIVALSPGAETHIPDIPYSTVLLDWSADVAESGPVGKFEDSDREELYRRLAVRVRELMETLRGEGAC
ncbi:MAG: phosphate signaling complex protein PhoU [Planctomycetota bacterium]